jgi:hypothetical protein
VWQKHKWEEDAVDWGDQLEVRVKQVMGLEVLENIPSWGRA